MGSRKKTRHTLINPFPFPPFLWRARPRARRMVRGVRALLARTAPGKLSGSGKFKCYRARTASDRPTGPKLRGITKLLAQRVFSSATLPSTPAWRGGAWTGEGGGLRRGTRRRRAGLAPGQRERRRAPRRQDAQAHALRLQRALLPPPRRPSGSQRVVIDPERRPRHGRRRRVHARRTTSSCSSSSSRGFGGSRARERGHAPASTPVQKAKDCRAAPPLCAAGGDAAPVRARIRHARASSRPRASTASRLSCSYVDDDGEREVRAARRGGERRGARLVDRIS